MRTLTSIDEQIIPFNAKPTIPEKQANGGLSLLFSQGITYNFEIYVGAQSKK